MVNTRIDVCPDIKYVEGRAKQELLDQQKFCPCRKRPVGGKEPSQAGHEGTHPSHDVHKPRSCSHGKFGYSGLSVIDTNHSSQTPPDFLGYSLRVPQLPNFSWIAQIQHRSGVGDE